jgi:hypothetical protein
VDNVREAFAINDVRRGWIGGATVRDAGRVGTDAQRATQQG